jgi:hypothetical protein
MPLDFDPKTLAFCSGLALKMKPSEVAQNCFLMPKACGAVRMGGYDVWVEKCRCNVPASHELDFVGVGSRNVFIFHHLPLEDGTGGEKVDDSQ